MTRRGQGMSRGRPAWPGRKSSKSIRWGAGAGHRFRRTGGPAATSLRGAPGTAGGRSSATRSAMCRNQTTMNWCRSRSRPGPLSARRPRARQVWLPGQESWGKGGSTKSPSLVAGLRAVPTRARRGASPCAVKGAGLAISLSLPGKFLAGGLGCRPCSWPSGGSDACGQVSVSTLAANGRRT
jgi:hypothetical protein